MVIQYLDEQNQSSPRSRLSYKYSIQDQGQDEASPSLDVHPPDGNLRCWSQSAEATHHAVPSRHQPRLRLLLRSDPAPSLQGLSAQ